MTVRIDSEEGFMRALLCLADDVGRGIVVSCSLHYEPTHIARMNICYAVGSEDISELPGIPGIQIEIDEVDAEADTVPGKGQKPKE